MVARSGNLIKCTMETLEATQEKVNKTCKLTFFGKIRKSNNNLYNFFFSPTKIKRIELNLIMH
jgi:hypothetical protein